MHRQWRKMLTKIKRLNWRRKRRRNQRRDLLSETKFRTMHRPTQVNLKRWRKSLRSRQVHRMMPFFHTRRLKSTKSKTWTWIHWTRHYSETSTSVGLNRPSKLMTTIDNRRKKSNMMTIAIYKVKRPQKTSHGHLPIARAIAMIRMTCLSRLKLKRCANSIRS